MIRLGKWDGKICVCKYMFQGVPEIMLQVLSNYIQVRYDVSRCLQKCRQVCVKVSTELAFLGVMF